jgi:hypothetical protein
MARRRLLKQVRLQASYDDAKQPTHYDLESLYASPSHKSQYQRLVHLQMAHPMAHSWVQTCDILTRTCQMDTHLKLAMVLCQSSKKNHNPRHDN